jgi:hypothetical protein
MGSTDKRSRLPSGPASWINSSSFQQVPSKSSRRSPRRGLRPARQHWESSRIARHAAQLRFHCGKPPPAADPSTRDHIPLLLRPIRRLYFAPISPEGCGPVSGTPPGPATAAIPPAERRTSSPRVRTQFPRTRGTPIQRDETERQQNPWLLPPLSRSTWRISVAALPSLERRRRRPRRCWDPGSAKV